MNDLLRQLIQNAVDNSSGDTFTGDRVTTSKADIAKLADYLAVNPPGPKAPIVVILSEGQVEDIQIPYEGYRVDVHDYDTVTDWELYADKDAEEPVEDWTEVDEHGDRYVVKTWQL